MSKLLLSSLSQKINLIFSYYGYECFFQHLLLNTYFRSLSPRQLETLKKNVLKPLLNNVSLMPRASASSNTAAPRALLNKLILSCKT